MIIWDFWIKMKSRQIAERSQEKTAQNNDVKKILKIWQIVWTIRSVYVGMGFWVQKARLFVQFIHTDFEGKFVGNVSIKFDFYVKQCFHTFISQNANLISRNEHTDVEMIFIQFQFEFHWKPLGFA